MKKTIVLLFVVAMMLGGCATHYSPHKNDSSPKTIYVTQDEDRVFAEVHAALIDRVNDAPVREINESIRGYSVRYTWGLDHTDYDVRVFPAIGVVGQQSHKGYYVEVSIHGTMMGASISGKKLYEDIQKRLSTFAKPIIVASIRPGTYIKERDEFRLTTAPSLREGGTLNVKQTGAGVADEIAKLNNLRKQGVLTESEYQQAKNNLLAQ